MAATADRSRFTTEKVDVDHEHDCQAIAANSQGLIGKSSLPRIFLSLSLLSFVFLFSLLPTPYTIRARPQSLGVAAALAALEAAAAVHRNVRRLVLKEEFLGPVWVRETSS